MTTVQTEEPLAEETHEHVDMLGRDLGVRDVLRDPDTRGLVFAPIMAFVIAGVMALATMQSGVSTGGTLIGVATVATATMLGVKWADEALCVLRSGHTCHTCSSEAERWEVSE